MRAWGKIETGMVATISTAHISKPELDILNDVYEHQTKTIEDPKHWINDLVWASHPYGYMVSGYGLRQIIKENKDVPEFLLEAAQLATDLDLAWLVYDEDGEEVEEMKNYYTED